MADSWADSRVVYGTIVLILSVFAIVANCGIIYYHSFLPNRKPIISLAISSILFQVCNLVVYIPCSFTNCSYYTNEWILVLCIPNTICYNVCHLCLVHLSIERMLIFYSETRHRSFQRKAMTFSSIIWIYIFGLAAAGFITGCVKTFDVPGLRFFYFADPVKGGAWFSNVYMGHSLSYPLVMLFCYVMIFVKIRILLNQSEYSHKKKELKLVLQYLFISFFAWFSVIFFFFLPNIKLWLNVKLTLLPIVVSTISTSSHCYVFLIFDKKMRQSLQKLCTRSAPTQVTSTVRLVSNGNSR